MLIFALDDEPLQLDVLLDAIHEAEPSAQVRGFGYAAAAVRAMQADNLRPDVVFTDIEMPGMTGMELARVFKETSPKTNLIFVTGFRQYAPEACALWPSGYVLKPVDANRIREELDHLRFPAEEPGKHRVRIQCFGNFEAFAGGRPVAFSRKKSKELLAYLVDRQGAGVSIAEAAGILWEDSPYSRSRQRQMQYVIADMLHSLAAVCAGDIVIRQRSTLSVDPSKFDCDLIAFLAGDPNAVNAYRGEYMVQYSWAEFSFRGAPSE